MKPYIIFIIASILMLPAIVMYPGIKKRQAELHLYAELDKCMKEYSVLPLDKPEEYMEKSHKIYADLCNVLMESSTSADYNSIGGRADTLLSEILNNQIVIIHCTDNILKQKEYIDRVVSPEIVMLGKVGDRYQLEAMKEMHDLNFGKGPQTFKEMFVRRDTKLPAPEKFQPVYPSVEETRIRECLDYYSSIMYKAEEALQVNAIKYLDLHADNPEYKEKFQPELDNYIRKYCIDLNQVFNSITIDLSEAERHDLRIMNLMLDIIKQQDGYARKYGSQSLLVDISKTYLLDETNKLEILNNN